MSNTADPKLSIYFDNGTTKLSKSDGAWDWMSDGKRCPCCNRKTREKIESFTGGFTEKRVCIEGKNTGCIG